MSKFAFHFQKLQIDLDSKASTIHLINDDVLAETIGGCGLGTQLLLETETAELDPFHRRGSLFFVFSPLVGSPLTTSAKFAVVSKSPLTNRINDSLAGSGFALAGKKTGFDAIEIVGKAERPTLLVVDNDSVRFEPAENIWGQTISETERLLKKVYGSAYRIACIGPAGENQVLFATISHDGRHAGRGGSGAILGSKNIKAILVRGNRQVAWADSENLQRHAKELSRKSFGPATAKYRELGTASNLLAFNRLECLPTRNFSAGHFEGAESLAPEELAEQRKRVRSSCVACTIGCEHLYPLSSPSSSKESPTNVRLEYESLFALGPLCGISEAETVLQAAKLCDELGLDTVSTGGTLAFAMDCARRGIANPPLEFGDSQSMLEMISRIALRSEWGDRLANGSRKLALEIGENSIEFAPQIKGLEIPGYDPRKLTTMALGFAVGTRGADHNKSSAYEIDFAEKRPDSSCGFHPSQIEQAIFLEDKAAVMDSLILCKFLRNVFDDFFEETSTLLNLATGWNLDGFELRKIGAHTIQKKKEFNIRAGWTPKEDRLPEMIFEKSSESSQVSFTKEELQSAISLYNLKRGWTKDGFQNETESIASNRKSVDEN